MSSSLFERSLQSQQHCVLALHFLQLPELTDRLLEAGRSVFFIICNNFYRKQTLHDSAEVTRSFITS